MDPVTIVVVGSGIIAIIEGVRRLRKPKPKLTDKLVTGPEAERELQSLKRATGRASRLSLTLLFVGSGLVVGALIASGGFDWDSESPTESSAALVFVIVGAVWGLLWVLVFLHMRRHTRHQNAKHQHD